MVSSAAPSATSWLPIGDFFSSSNSFIASRRFWSRTCAYRGTICVDECPSRKAWANTLKKAGLPFFPIYYLRHTFASRLTSAGVSPLTIAQMLGHSSTQIVPRYAQVLDQNRLDAMRKLEALKKSAIGSHEVAEAAADETVQGIRQ